MLETEKQLLKNVLKILYEKTYPLVILLMLIIDS